MRGPAACATLLLVFFGISVGSSKQANNPAHNQPCPGIGCSANPEPQPAPQPEQDASHHGTSIKEVFLNLPSDQKSIWTAPLHLKLRDLSWLAPLGATTGILIASDQQNMQREHSNGDAISLSNKISNTGTVALFALPATMYLWGTLHGTDRSRETGLLTGEALINSFIVDEALKSALGRQTPTGKGGQGHFFQQFGNPSFPSDHSMLSWTAASVIAHEYPGWLSQSLAYGTASAVSISRITGREHFPSDVVVGGALGWMIGRHIFQSRHDTDLDNAEYGNFIPERRMFEGPQTGATYVPIDSWVYAAFDQLMALGYVRTSEAGMRSWTRAECARLVTEAEEATDDSSGDLSTLTVHALAAEFAPELKGKQSQPDIAIEEVYTRVGYVNGQPLADDYHFAKSFTNDFGRPFGQGANDVTGVSIRTGVGPLAFYIRGEYQHAGALPAEPLLAQQAITNVEGLPSAPPQTTATLDRFRLLDTYVSYNFHNNVVSFGKQTLWWGPGADAPFLASDNAEPIPMLRISRASPFTLPWLFRLMGPIRVEAFWGQLEGQDFVALDSAGHRDVVSSPLRPHPAIQGAKFSFRPTGNLEFGFDETAIFSGPGFPLTIHSILRSYSPGNTIPGVSSDPGDRRSGFDFSYRLPRLRNWLTLYSDSFTEDEISPISFPRKSSFRAGLYAPKLPYIPNLDLRVEGIYTDIPNLGAAGVEYFNNHYLSGYTNFGQIIGNAIGREGRGLNVWTTYRFTPINNVQLHYRNQHVNPEFLEGGYLRDFNATGTFASVRSMIFSASLKYERWNFPLLSAAPKTNISGVLQISFRPVHGWSPWTRN